MDISILAAQNPWWRGRELISEDYDLCKWGAKKHRWVPKLVGEIGLKPFALHAVLGPRQAGKTTAMKLLVKELLPDRDPRGIFYFNCEAVGDYKELMELLEAYFTFREAGGVASSVIILDEITSPKEWYRGLKALIDAGRLEHDIVILTGSVSMAIKKQVELFPGRRGGGRDFTLMPLSFRDFVGVLEPELLKKIEPAKSLEPAELRRKAALAMPHLKELDRLLVKHMAYGGFPLGIEALGGGRDEAKQVYLSWVRNTVLKAERSDLIARQIIKAILEKLPSPMSWEGISQRIDVKSPKTVAAYVELLESSFVLKTLYNADINERTIKFGKNKKIHIVDPLVLELFEDWCLVRIKNRDSVLAESLVAIALSRAFPDKAFFWRNGFEVDVLVLDGKKLRGFEVKWSERPEAKRLPQLDSLALVTKKDFFPEPLAVPLSVFLGILEI